MTPGPALILPVGAVVTAFFLLVFPLAVLVAVWATVSLFRVLFPERAPRALPQKRSAGRTATVREIVRQQRAQTAEAPERVATTDFPARTPLEEALWARRN